MVGSAIVRRLEAEGYSNILTRGSAERICGTRRLSPVFEVERPEYVVLAAAKVGGIWPTTPTGRSLGMITHDRGPYHS